MSCRYADFARESALDGSGSCMTFQALWCRKQKKHVIKNSRCQVRYSEAASYR